MIEFKSYDVDVIKSFLPYFKNEGIHSCDYTLGIKYMWHDYFDSKYAIIDNTLAIKETYDVCKCSFYYPMGKNVDKMLDEIKKYAISTCLCQRLEFCCVDESKIEALKKKFPHSEVMYNRNWSDYLYLNKNFQEFAGGDYSNKRHHVKKFIKTYPQVTFNVAKTSDKQRIADFIVEFEKTKELETVESKYELKQAINLAMHFDELGFDAFYLEDNGKLIAVSICEVINDCVYDHIEKALRSYDSVYPFFVNKIANYYKDITYFNREDDSGDEGLRFSKEDYHPIKMITKNMFYVRNNLDIIDDLPTLKVDEEIKLEKLLPENKQDYFDLYTDEKLNKYWGYDYKTDLNGATLNPDYFYNMVQDDFNKKAYFSWMIKKNNKLIGELVVGELTNNNDCEIGYRIIESEQHKGIVFKSMLVLLDYLLGSLMLSRVRAKAYKENVASISLLKKLGFTQVSEDDKFLYFKN